jgi:succinyl-diaminopimelate desuccinylase
VSGYHPQKFAEKFSHALEVAVQAKPEGGICGFELEWNLLDSQFQPLLTLESESIKLSFIDYLRSKVLPSFAYESTQLEVFHWMVEWASKPYYQIRAAVYESRLAEALIINSLHKASNQYGERLYCWHGNLLVDAVVGHDSIPGSWHIAKRRYLEKCVDLYGNRLATAGIHTNLSIPEPLLTWDFVHLPSSDYSRAINSPLHLDDYKNQIYILGTRLMRAFATLFIATTASTPLEPTNEEGGAHVILSENDSVRNLTFPNPPQLDEPNLYRTYEDYLHLSYDLVRNGIRFGNNNWTPVRARSFAEPVERLIAITSEQLQDLYARGFYTDDESIKIEDLAKQIEVQNLLARINLPMARVEIRTDEGGHPLDVDIANLTFKYLILLKIYGDKNFARSFRYDQEDIERARRNETLAAKNGLRAEIENPFSGKPSNMREFLKWTLNEVEPLGRELNLWEDLQPLVDMANGSPNTAEHIRNRLHKELGASNRVPVEILERLALERENEVKHDIEQISEAIPQFAKEAYKLSDIIQNSQEFVSEDLDAPIRFNTKSRLLLEVKQLDKPSEIIQLAEQLIKIPSVTACPEERLDEVRKAITFILDYASGTRLSVRYFNENKYPAVLLGFPEFPSAPVMFAGHVDVVAPDPDDRQFVPRIEGNYLWGRGSADMKTVVATYLVWMKDRLKTGSSQVPINLLLVGNEENGEGQPFGTPHVLKKMQVEHSYQPEIIIAGERTGENGDELWGEICTQNRGILRFDIIAKGVKTHSGVSLTKNTFGSSTISDRLLAARDEIQIIASKFLTLEGDSAWKSQLNYPFLHVGSVGIYNITPSEGILGVEIRPIPGDDIESFHNEVNQYCKRKDLILSTKVMEPGISCDLENQYLIRLIQAVQKASNKLANIGKKLPGTSARFAPAGQGVVWGQAGIGPHSSNEKHYIPSIMPYYKSLDIFADLVSDLKTT